MTLVRDDVEKTGPEFNPRSLIEAREKTVQAVKAIASNVKPGMLEEEAYEMAKTLIERVGAEKHWHRPWIRFGPNTLLPYGEQSQPGVRLASDDIFFIDIGPVWNGYEGDGGDTFAVGSDPEMIKCAADVKEIFNEVKVYWAKNRVTGAELYKFAYQTARGRGWMLTTRGASGHRLSDFPHKIYYKGGLTDVDFVPSPCAWMLEIQIRHPKRPFGAFCEDLLF